MEKITQKKLENMSADARINFFKESVIDYDTIIKARANSAIDFTLGINSEMKPKIVEAFQMRVEDHLNIPGANYGGSSLEHLPQLGIITQITYLRLNEQAAYLAGEIIKKAGFPNYAKPAYETREQLVDISNKNFIDYLKQREALQKTN